MAMTKHREGELVFDFGDAACVKFDVQGEKPGSSMKRVDFILSDGKKIVFVEVKDPSHSRATPEERADFVKKMKNNELVFNDLVPKARDTYLYCHLMGCDIRNVGYVVVLGIAELGLKPEDLEPLTDRLCKRLKQDADTPWLRPYIAETFVVTPENFFKHFPRYRVDRNAAPS